MPNEYDVARIKWIKRQREIYVAQLQILETGFRNPYDGSADDTIFVNSEASKRALKGWIHEIDNMLGFEDADRT